MSWVRVERTGAVAEIILDNPEKHNALSAALLDELLAAVAELAVDRAVRVAIVHGGTAKAFCAGADLKERMGLDEAQVFGAVHRTREAAGGLEQLPMPVIAAIHGACFGGGLELALACDIRLAAEDARLGLTEVGLAIIPGAGGTQRLPQVVGIARAKELIYTAARLTAAEAAQIGLVNRVVSGAGLLAEARAMAGRMAELGPLALRAAKRALNAGQQLGDGLRAEWEAYQSIIPTADRREGLRAFAEKRKPEYRGE